MGNAYFAAAVTRFGTQAAAVTDADPGEFGVYVLNNFLTEQARNAWINSGTFTTAARAQDFLYYHNMPPPPPPSVPDGGTTMMLLGGAMLGLGGLRRKLGPRA
jgi:hypothetical protein